VFFLGMQLVDAGQHLLGRYLMNEFPVTVVYIGSFLNEILVIALSAIWFFVLFVVLPDGKPHWKVAMAGALMTSVLFNAGKWVLQLLLKPGQVHNFYGASGALVLLLLFVFYSSIILYFGAAFIKVWGNYCNQPVRLRPHVMMYELQEVGA